MMIHIGDYQQTNRPRSLAQDKLAITRQPTKSGCGNRLGYVVDFRPGHQWSRCYGVEV